MIAIIRPVPATLAACQLTHVARVPIDVERARAQHEVYEATLRRLGLDVVRVPAADDQPDSAFVEDAAIALDGCALLAPMGSPARRPEVAAVARVLARHVELVHAGAPGRFEGGDVLRVGRTLFVGQSTRTDRDGLALIRSFAAPRGFEVKPVAVRGCLHLKTAATCIADDTVLLDPGRVPAGDFTGLHIIHVDRHEPGAANTLRTGGTLLVPRGCPRTAGRLEKAGFAVQDLDISELEKAEAGLTCMSILID